MSPTQMTPEQRGEDRFAVFVSPTYGFRAMAIIVRNYEHLYGIHTISSVIDRWAPPQENNTIAYKKAVVDEINRDHIPDLITPITEGTPVPLDNPTIMRALCHAIADHESGGFFFSISDLYAGVKMAVGGD